ncbi:MAG: helicase [Cyanobacteriota bacterium]|nr:helicase [Cyanobacteriota bacterium]
MLEARAHHQLKALLAGEGAQRWPHHLTLSRLVARSLRRGDQTLVRLAAGTDPSWWISLLVPLALGETPVALVVSDALRQRLLQVEWPRLRTVGLALPCWEGPDAPETGALWLLNHRQLLQAWNQGRLGARQLVIPEVELLETALRQALAVQIEPGDWERLLRVLPAAEASLMSLHGRLGQRLLRHPRTPHGLVALAADDEAPLRHLLSVLQPLPDPWRAWLQASGDGWCSWARVEPDQMRWRLHRQPLEPLAQLAGLLKNRGVVLAGELALPGRGGPATGGAAGAGASTPLEGSLAALALQPVVVVELSDPPLTDPLPLYAPLRQPLPNSPFFGEHLLEQSRRLVLGQSGLTVVLVDDPALRGSLASGLAAEFGSRVGVESTAPESNGVLCCRWNWWLENQGRLPLPCQVLVALLPIASLEEPLTAARVARLRQQGRDWFRELLLPDALNRLQRSVAGLRRSGGRLAVLDGRLRGRSWGRQVFRALEPWSPLTRLLPD